MSVEWDGIAIPMKDSGEVKEEENFYIPDPRGHAEDSADRLKKILDAKYKPADLRKVCEEQLQLDTCKNKTCCTVSSKSTPTCSMERWASGGWMTTM